MPNGSTRRTAKLGHGLQTTRDRLHIKWALWGAADDATLYRPELIRDKQCGGRLDYKHANASFRPVVWASRMSR
jgi:hypothetical protein